MFYLDSIQKSLGNEISDDVRPRSKIDEYVVGHLNTEESVSGGLSSPSDDAHNIMMKAISSSQQLSCLRIRRNILNKLPLLDYLK